MALDYIPGRGWVFRGGGGNGGAVGGGNAVNGEAEANRIAAVARQEKEFREANHWNSEKDYTDNWGGLFGGVKDMYNYSASFGAGPNQNWQGALQGRLQNRANGDYERISDFENKSRTSGADYQRKMFARNNAIEEMYRQGYSKEQISNHVTGKVNINSVDPDYADYHKYLNGGDTSAAGMLSSSQAQPEEWMKDYFKFNHADAKPGMGNGAQQMFSNGINSQAAQILVDGAAQASTQRANNAAQMSSQMLNSPTQPISSRIKRPKAQQGIVNDGLFSGLSQADVYADLLKRLGRSA